MAKIGTAHVEVKPVLNEEALADLERRIENAVARGVERGMARLNVPERTGKEVARAINAAATGAARRKP